MLCASCLSAPAIAAETSDLASRFQLSGFGTLAGSYSSRDDLTPLREWGQRDTFNGRWSWKLDSLIGAQVNARLTPQVDAAVQLVLKERAVQTLEQSLELAFVGWRPWSDTKVRAGRLGIDFYLLSDYRNVSYAYLWERPPVELYGLGLPLHFDGVDVSHRLSLAGGDLVFKVIWGWSEYAIDMGEGLGAELVRADPLWGGRISFERGSWRLSAGVGRLTPDGDFEFLTTSGLLPALTSPLLQQLWPQSGDYAEDLSGDGKAATFYAVGAAYEDSVWQISGEVGYLDSNYSVLRDTLSGYLSVGRRFGSITPYAVLAAARPQEHRRSLEPPSDLALAYAPEIQQLYDALDAFYARLGTDQTTLSLGARWDLRENLAVKAQWNHTTTKAYDLWSNDRIVSGSEESVDLFSLSLNWIF